MTEEEESYESISHKFVVENGKVEKEIFGKDGGKNVPHILKGTNYDGANNSMKEKKDFRRWNSVYGDNTSSEDDRSDGRSEDDMYDRASSVYSSVYHDT